MAPTKELNLAGGQPAAQCHLMPCKIEHNEPTARAREYFWPTIRRLHDDDAQGRGDEKQRPSAGADYSQKDHHNLADDGSVFMASFRGRPLQGKQVKLPVGYKGFVVPKELSGSSARGLTTRSFTEFTYWNWDELPSNEDKVNKALAWLKVAKAVHNPVD